MALVCVDRPGFEAETRESPDSSRGLRPVSCQKSAFVQLDFGQVTGSNLREGHEGKSLADNSLCLSTDLAG